MPTYQEALSINEQYALDNDKEPTAVRILLMNFSGLSGAELLARMQDMMQADMYQRFRNAVDAYVIEHKPTQHITECEHFYGYRFGVNENVLIPRFETEELIGYLLDYKAELFGDTPVRVADIGTGSGCLAITLALEDENIEAHATDISEPALKVARQNSENLGANVTFHAGDMLAPLQGQGTFDILVSNPPYIPNHEHVEALVKNHEPHIALFGGEDGLDYYRAILRQAESIMNGRYIIAFEHAYDKAKEIRKLCKKYLKNTRIIQKKDMQGKDRMTFVLRP